MQFDWELEVARRGGRRVMRELMLLSGALVAFGNDGSCDRARFSVLW